METYGQPITWLTHMGQTLFNTCQSITNFLSREYTLGTATLSIFDIIFGVGVVIVLGMILIKWIIS